MADVDDVADMTAINRKMPSAPPTRIEGAGLSLPPHENSALGVYLFSSVRFGGVFPPLC
jgi:hypothetical protein